MIDPRAVCRCGRPAELVGIDVRLEGAFWTLRCAPCRASFTVHAWERPGGSRARRLPLGRWIRGSPARTFAASTYNRSTM